MKKNSFWIVLVLLGISLIGYAIYEMSSTTIQTKQALKEAKNVISQAPTSNDEGEAIIPPDGVIGLLELPRIEAELAIVKGTDPDDLEKGVGHYEGSYFPGQNGQVVLSGHRDTVFKRVGELELGDDIIVNMASGKYEYEIVHTKIVDADDKSVITLQHQEEELILTTCYPFGYIGDAPQRYIIYANRTQ